jgi:hypothetical protein
VERFNLAKCFLRLSSDPVRHKLLLVQSSPFNNQAQYSRRQPTGEKRQVSYLDQSFFLPVLGMKVRRGVLLKKHFDHNAEKTADLRRESALAAAPGITRVPGFS